MATKTGADSAVQGRTTGWRKQGGYWEKYVKDFAGPTAEADAQAAGYALVNSGYEWTVTPIGESGCYRLEATGEDSLGSGSINPNLPLSDVWELQPNMVEKDFLDADIAIFNALTNDQKKLIRDALTATGVTALTGDSLTAFKLKTAGVNSVVIFAPIIRRTRIVRRDYTLKDAQTNVGSIITAANFQSVEGVPSILLFNIPSNSNPTRADGVTTIYGWLKKAPVITQISGGKWNLQQEWAYGSWASALYQSV